MTGEGRFALSRECPHLRIEIWAPDSGLQFRCGPPVEDEAVAKTGIRI
jgi:hypothetical protein